MSFDLLGRRRPARVRAAAVRRRFSAWRGERPFWAGAFTFSAGLPILYFPYLHLHLGGIPMALSTTAGAGSLIIGVLLMTLGVSLWFQPQTRVFAGIAAQLLALVSFPVANLGGLFLGLFGGLIGGCLACAWLPPTDTAESASAVDPAALPVTAGEEAGRGE